MNTLYTERGYAHSDWWLNNDVRTLRKIYKLIDDIKRHPYTGLGHPEPLSHDLTGLWSRHIDDKNRLVYRVIKGETDDDSYVEISRCKGHYNDK